MIIWNYDYIIRGCRQRWRQRLASKVGVQGGVNNEKSFLLHFLILTVK